MSSKISGIDTRTAPAGAARAVARARDAATGAQQDSGAASGVHITGSARQLADLEQMVKDLPAVDEAKVAAVSSALESGTYRISPERIADQLLHIEQALAPLGQSSK